MIYVIKEANFLARTHNYRTNKKGELVIDFKRFVSKEERIARLKSDIMKTCYVPKGIDSITINII